MTSPAENQLAQVESANPEAMRGAANNWQQSLVALQALSTKLENARTQMLAAAEGDAADAAIAAFDVMAAQVDDNITRMTLAKTALELAANRLQDAKTELTAVRGMAIPDVGAQPTMPPVDATPEETDAYQEDLAAHNASKTNATNIAKQREEKAAAALTTLDEGLAQAEARLTKAAPSAKQSDDEEYIPTGSNTPRAPRTAPPASGSYLGPGHHGVLHGFVPEHQGEPGGNPNGGPEGGPNGGPEGGPEGGPHGPEGGPRGENEGGPQGGIPRPGSVGGGIGGAVGGAAGLIGAARGIKGLRSMLSGGKPGMPLGGTGAKGTASVLGKGGQAVGGMGQGQSGGARGTGGAGGAGGKAVGGMGQGQRGGAGGAGGRGGAGGTGGRGGAGTGKATGAMGGRNGAGGAGGRGGAGAGAGAGKATGAMGGRGGKNQRDAADVEHLTFEDDQWLDGDETAPRVIE